MRRALLAGVCVSSMFAAACGGAPDPEPAQRVASPVYGGFVDEADKGVVALSYGFQTFVFGSHCSGSLIAPNLVLTARHCVPSFTGGQGSDPGVVCGASPTNNPPPGTFFFATTDTSSSRTGHWYPGAGTVAVTGGNDLCGNDVALVTLAGAGIPGSEATPIIPRIDVPPEVLEPISAAGYGLTDPNDNNSGGTRNRFDGAEVECTDSSCGFNIVDGEFSTNAPACPGDSGGPALDAQGRVIGVTSRGPQGCTSIVYSTVSHWKELIIDTAKAAAVSGGYEPAHWVTSGDSTPPVATPDGGAGASGDSGPPDPTGTACGPTQGCALGWPCQQTGVPDVGVCVPPCSAGNTTCPAGHACDPSVGACLDTSLTGAGGAAGNGAKAESGDSGGCAVALANGPVQPVPWVVGALGAVLLGLRRRRAR